jgi:hypothetical protein
VSARMSITVGEITAIVDAVRSTGLTKMTAETSEYDRVTAARAPSTSQGRQGLADAGSEQYVSCVN